MKIIVMLTLLRVSHCEHIVSSRKAVCDESFPERASLRLRTRMVEPLKLAPRGRRSKSDGLTPTPENAVGFFHWVVPVNPQGLKNRLGAIDASFVKTSVMPSGTA